MPCPLADAVAKEYIGYANRVTAAEADTSVAVLEEQANELDRRSAYWTRPSPAAAPSWLANARGHRRLCLSALLDSLRTAQVDAARQLSSLNTRIAESRLNVELGRRGTRVLGPMERPDHPERPRPSRNIGVGGLAGLIGGAMLAVTLDQRDRRLLTRGEIADAVGSPVRASLSVPPHDSIEACTAVLEAWTARHLAWASSSRTIEAITLAFRQPRVIARRSREYSGVFSSNAHRSLTFPLRKSQLPQAGVLTSARSELP